MYWKSKKVKVLTSVKDICNSLKEGFVNDKVIEMTETNYTLSISHDQS